MNEKVSSYPNISDIDPLSLTSVYLECFSLGISLGTATGFIVKHNTTGYYVITNWHVVSGKNAETGELLDKVTGAVPRLLSLQQVKKMMGSNYKP
jgi:hypothetical protein